MIAFLAGLLGAIAPYLIITWGAYGFFLAVFWALCLYAIKDEWK